MVKGTIKFQSHMGVFKLRSSSGSNCQYGGPQRLHLKLDEPHAFPAHGITICDRREALVEWKGLQVRELTLSPNNLHALLYDV
jgi:hypothetical protein